MHPSVKSQDDPPPQYWSNRIPQFWATPILYISAVTKLDSMPLIEAVALWDVSLMANACHDMYAKCVSIVCGSLFLVGNSDSDGRHH